LVGLPVERSISISKPQLGVELGAVVERSLIVAAARPCASSVGLHWPVVTSRSSRSARTCRRTAP